MDCAACAHVSLRAASARLVALHQALEHGQARQFDQAVVPNKLLHDIFHSKSDK